jgi:hypothetical protein
MAAANHKTTLSPHGRFSLYNIIVQHYYFQFSIDRQPASEDKREPATSDGRLDKTTKRHSRDYRLSVDHALHYCQHSAFGERPENKRDERHKRLGRSPVHLHPHIGIGIGIGFFLVSLLLLLPFIFPCPFPILSLNSIGLPSHPFEAGHQQPVECLFLHIGIVLFLLFFLLQLSLSLLMGTHNTRIWPIRALMHLYITILLLLLHEKGEGGGKV